MTEIKIDTAYWGQRAFGMLQELAACSENHSGPLGEVGVTRLPYTEQHKAANELLSEWMIEAGMTVSLDAAATLIGRMPGQNGGKTLLLGSHQDSVRQGGGFDGIMGVVLPIVVMLALKDAGWKPPFSIEVLAFADEEGVRFPTALTGPRALAGTLDPTVLQLRDRDGIRLGEALTDFGGDENQIVTIARSASDILGYLEVHIEQGPVLEDQDQPLGIVTGICGIERHQIVVTGVAAHAGTMPMHLRQDAMAGAAWIVAQIEEMARSDDRLLGVVGELNVFPNAVNAVPGRVELTAELRSVDDETREGAGQRLRDFCLELANERGLEIQIERTYFQAATPCSGALQSALQDACPSAPRMPSGATHDASAMADLCDIGMLFVRCRNGISHNPKEFATGEDMGQAIQALAKFLSHKESQL
ncbi:M20 family metallo-hydrolase [Thalassobius sp. MITS945101]|uniref:M20 family metallo-hydrolase n=2 Tax=Roseobacteraceae TaxID=2854170 RepID=UPI00399958CF